MFLENGIVTLEENEIEKLNMIRMDQVEEIREFDVDVAKLVNEISGNYDIKYHHLIWKVTGNIHFNTIMNGYSKLLADYPYLRSNFITGVLEKDIMVTYKPEDKLFPVANIMDYGKEQQYERLVNIVAAEGRCTYNMMKNPPLRMQGILIGENELAVVISFIPQFCRNISRGRLAQYVFADMSFKEGSHTLISNSANALNENIERENIEYWKREIRSGVRPVSIQGQSENSSKRSGIESIQKSLGGSLYSSVKGFARKNSISIKTFIVYSWLSFLGDLTGENNPTILMLGNNGEPAYYPVSLDCGMGLNDKLDYVNHKLLYARKYGFIQDSHYEDAFGKDFVGKFRVRFNVVDMEAISKDDNWLNIYNDYSSEKADLRIQCYFSKETCYFNYSYNDEIYYGDIISFVHEKFIAYINGIIGKEQIALNSNEFKNNSQSIEDYKKRLNQICIKSILNTDVFKYCNEDEASELASKAVVRKMTMDDKIMIEGDVADTICIIASGNVEESTPDKNGIEKPLRIVSKGAVIGVEALSYYNVVRRTYSVAGNEAVVIFIPVSDVEVVVDSNPKIWKSILQHITDRLEKYEKIWVRE